MEYLILAAALLIVGLAIFLLQAAQAKKQRAWQKKKLETSFGSPADRKYEPGELLGIQGYFHKHRVGTSLDDITWKDLDMDRVFMQMNITESSAGQEYLYAMLRTPLLEEEKLLHRERLIRFFADHPRERLDLQMRFRALGRTGKYSLYEYLDFLEDLGPRSNGKQILLDLLVVAAVIAMFFWPRQGMFVLICLLAYLISSYLKEKGAIEPYLISFQYVLRTMAAAREICRQDIRELSEENGRLREYLKQLKELKAGAAFGMYTMGDGGNPLHVLTDYLNMVFHFDIIGFNCMVKQVRLHTRQIDEMLTILGEIEALIAVAGFRKGLEEWCLPQFEPEGLSLEKLYHPLLRDPVKNDLTVRRGVLLTGSNASGKSTFLKAVAINAILAQTIHTCCAQRYQGAFFRVMTSMALQDDLINGESYYIVEIKSIKRILDAAGEDGAKVLCFVDEVLRGTNTVERIAASVQILHSLSCPQVCCLAATHDIELAELLQQEYDNYHFEEQIEEGDIRFPYRLMPGKAKTRNAIRLLSIMGYDSGIIRRAEEMAACFEKTGKWEQV